MKKLIIGVFCFLGCFVTTAWGCIASGPIRGMYEVRDGQVYYEQSYKSGPVLVEGADATTLNYVSEGLRDGERKKFFSDYVLDKDHVYFQGGILKGIDPAEAVLLWQYFDDVVLIDGLEKIIDSVEKHAADKEGEQHGAYLKGGTLVYYSARLLEGVDGENFDRMPLHEKGHNFFRDNYMQDDQHIYLYGKRVAGDAKTAAEIGYGYYADAKHLYFRGEVLQGALPDAFEVKGVFVISNGSVYYRAQQLKLDAGSFEVLRYIDGRAISIVACGGTVYAGSFVKDKNGVYALHVTGELNRLNVVADAGVSGVYAYRERVWSGYRWGGSVFYRDGETLYFFNSVAEGSGSLESFLGGDAETFGVYAVLKEEVIFRDKAGFYVAKRYFGGNGLSKVANGDAKLVCLEDDHLCLISDGTLYYVFNDGRVEQVQASVLQDAQDDTGKRAELERKRMESLKKINVEREQLKVDDIPKGSFFQRSYRL